MAQADFVVANGTGAAVRSDLNGQLAAIVSNNSGATEPATMYAYQWWANTTTGLLLIRNAANSAWVTVGTLADANLGLLPLAGGTMTGALVAALGTSSVPGISFTGDLDTGLSAAAANTLVLSTNGTARLTASTTAVTSSLPIDVPLGSVGAPSLTFTGDLDTGILSPSANQLAIATNGVERVEFGTTEVVFNDGGVNYDFRVEGDTKADLFLVDASADAVLLGSQANLRWADADSSNYIAVQAPSTVSSNVTFTLPSADGTSGQCLSTNGSGTLSFATGGFAPGTVMLFVQSAAPTGWTKSTTHDNKALRVVSGSVTTGGTQNFTAVLNGNVGATTLSISQIPLHNHQSPYLFNNSNSGGVSNRDGGGSFANLANGYNASLVTGASGGGGSHTHSMDVAYVDVIIATKD